MSLVDGVAAIMFVGVLLYAIFAGADFGSGVWDLAAGSAAKGGRLRRLIDHAIGPVWEANHVWLIFVLVFLWTGFPDAFAQLMRTLAIPFWFAGLGIVLRGSGFAFRKLSPSLRWARIAGVIFAGSSLITPFFLGAIVGAVASGRVPAEGRGELWSSWLNPTSILGGVLAVLTCTFLAGVFLAADAESLGAADLADWIRGRAIVLGGITGTVALIGIVPLSVDADTLFDRLAGRGSVFVLASGLAGATTLVLLRSGRLRAARLSAIGAVGSVIAGWGVAQHPWILVDELRLDDAPAPTATLWGLIVAFALAVVLVVPSLTYLFVLADRNRVGTEAAPEPAPPGGS